VLVRCRARDVLAQIDPKNMELKQLVETTVQPSETQDISLVAAPAGDIFYYAAVHANVLLRLDPTSFELTPISVPDSLGMNVSVGVDGRLYFYGGPAESTVSAFDPGTGELSIDLPELRSPPGTYIRALFVR
jgi:streptogramin lyase